MLTVLSTTGILGILAIVFLIFCFVRLLKKKFTRRSFNGDGPVSPSVFIAAVGAGFLFLTWLFAPLFFTQALFIFMGLGLATALADSKKEISFAGLNNYFVFVIFIFCAVLIMGGFYSLSLAGKKYAGAIYYAKGLSSVNLQGNLDKAISQLDKARQLDTDSDQYFRTLSQLLFAKTGEIAKQNASSESPQIAQAEIQNAIAITAQVARQATVINSQDSLNWDNLGSIYEGFIPLEADAADLAEESYLKAAALDPKNPQELVNLARGLVSAVDIYGADNSGLKQEKLNKARSYLESALKLKNDYAPANFLAAVVALREGKIDEAISRLELIKQSVSLNAELAFQLGLLYYQNNQFDKAKLEFQRSVDNNPDNSNTRYFLGLIYDQLGNKAGALSQFKKVAELNPDNEEVKKIVENLQNGRSALESIVSPVRPAAERIEAPILEVKE